MTFHDWNLEQAYVRNIERGDLVLLDGIYGMERVTAVSSEPLASSTETVVRLALVTASREPGGNGVSRFVARFPHEPCLRVPPPTEKPAISGFSDDDPAALGEDQRAYAASRACAATDRGQVF